jgi:hypothetical protein
MYGFTRVRGSRHALIALTACVIVGVLAFAATPALATEGKPPVIVSIGWGAGGEVIVNAQINPEDLETTYEIDLECSSCVPGYSPAVGTLPAVDEARTVTLNVTGIQAGSYRIAVFAHNAAGNASQTGELDVSGSRYVPPELPWANQSGDEAAARTVAEQRAKEHEEQQAKEAAVQLAAARKRAEEAAQQAEAEAAARLREETEHPACVVPALKGDTLTAAARALATAHCRLGAIHRPAHHRGALRVTAEGALPGVRLATDSRVVLWLGGKRSLRRRRRGAR